MRKLSLDTNVWLEMLLQQEHADEVRSLLRVVPLTDVATTDFSIHSIGIILTGKGKDAAFGKFVTDVLQDTPVVEVRLGLSDLNRLLAVRERHRLDFDDAYQYVAAEKHDLTLVSFDSDFDRTERGRKTPKELLKSISNEPGSGFIARDRPTSPSRPKTKSRKRG